MRLHLCTYPGAFLNGQTRDAVTRSVQATEAIGAAASTAGRACPSLRPSLRIYLCDTDEQAWSQARSEPAYQAFPSKSATVSDHTRSEDAERNAAAAA